ncbi:sulfite exporter TauE/SafE family protein 3-like isoform X2 [Phalaenopsis equestris]|uniref:sulfite exporter TauE/SafE family protein 3-like isoform X2 n=1 Tax=Phalaenopsis equestris TaxID=78828 RepID=UPI0009E28174|nr:sulfite exporter TauE/SafE family protein 3-like isoform X2 [Phalaenopsis equestris]
MAEWKQKRAWWWLSLLFFLCLVLDHKIAQAKRPISSEMENHNKTTFEAYRHLFANAFGALFEPGDSTTRVWPDMEFGWRVVLGSVIGFLGAALGSIGGVGGGGIFVPMLTLIIGFDPKTSTAISKCMIMGAAGSTVYYNLRLRHPTMDLPIIDYDLALLFQPMLMLGISIGVAFNVMFPDWMVTVLLIILFLGTSTKALFKGIETWKKESVMKKEATKLLASSSNLEGTEQEYKPVPGGPASNMQLKSSMDDEVPIKDNILWKELMVLLSVWVAFLAVQIVKTYATTCSVEYWILNILQVPIALSVTIYEAASLIKGRRKIASRGKQNICWKGLQLFLYCCFGVLAGIVGGLLGLGGGFILGPLFLEMGVPPQVASATSTFAMTFSSSMSVIQYYLLDRFPVPYASYFVFLATVAAFTGQHIVRKLIILLGRASLIIFILALTIFVSAISLGGVGIANMVEKLDRKDHIGFENLCYRT